MFSGKGSSAGRKNGGVGRKLDVQKDMKGSRNGLTTPRGIFLLPASPQECRWCKIS